MQGADIDVKHVEGGSVLTEFSGEGWADLIKQVLQQPSTDQAFCSNLALRQQRSLAVAVLQRSPAS